MAIGYNFKIPSCNVQNQDLHTLNAKVLQKQVSFYYIYGLVLLKSFFEALQFICCLLPYETLRESWGGT